MTGQTNEVQWYIAREGKQHGPLTEVEMRTFVAHSYLRPSDLIWRAGMPDWLPAPTVFPAIFQPANPAPVQTQPAAAPVRTTIQQQVQANSAAATQSDFDPSRGIDKPKRSLFQQFGLAVVALSLISGVGLGLTVYREPLMRLIPGISRAAEPASAKEKIAEKATDAAKSQPVATPAAVTPPTAPPAAPVAVDGSATDVRLQKIPLWNYIKAQFPDWYGTQIAGAEKLLAEKKPDAEVAGFLAQGLVALRRQNADKALAASPELLKKMAGAFLENLKALKAQSIGACYGFISKGENSPGVIELLQNPETATAFNAQASSILEAAIEGGKRPSKHESAGKGDYELLIKELGKIGWKDEDLQVFSNPRLLAKREPAQVCQMVQDWFTAHLAVQDPPAQDRLLYETLKPVVQG